MGSAYLFGLAQANLEINAVQGILIGAFVFVPLFLREKITTITQFIAQKLGQKIALFYSIVNIMLFATVTIGAALFWGAYAAELVFGEQLSLLHSDRIVRIAMLILILGVFSAIYTYLGGLSAVVKTDIIQFSVLIIGGIVVCLTAVNQLGGWEQLYIKHQKECTTSSFRSPNLTMDTFIRIVFTQHQLLVCKSTVMQRALAAKSVAHAQAGLLAGGLIKYLMAIIKLFLE